MKLLLFVLYCCVCARASDFSGETFNFTGLTGFPKSFIFGTATSAYQVEGAWNISGKGENIWDRITHTQPNWIIDHNNADITCDSYNKYKEDVANIKAIGFQMYRFSISWSRLFPTGFVSYVNEDGVRYYNALIDELLSNGIQPMVTLYHWDLPQPLQDIGGWLNPKIADIFGDYARAVYKLFGDRVKWWVTINEPLQIKDGYGFVSAAPALNYHGYGEYISAHNLLRAHAKAYRIYDNEFKKSQGGKVTIVVSGDFYYPKNKTDPLHIEAAERGNQLTFGWFLHPIFTEEGDYPPLMREIIDRNSRAEGLNQSRLPYFTKDEIQEIKGSADYLGLNHYGSHNAEPGLQGDNPSYTRDTNIIPTNIPGASFTDLGISVYPEGMRSILNWLKNEYNNPEIFITENGYAGGKDIIDDTGRIEYYSGYLRNLLKAINEDNCRVLGHTAWSLMDNFEWRIGFIVKYGLIRVDFSSPKRERTWKKSAEFYRQLLKANSR